MKNSSHLYVVHEENGLTIISKTPKEAINYLISKSVMPSQIAISKKKEIAAAEFYLEQGAQVNGESISRSLKRFKVSRGIILTTKQKELTNNARSFLEILDSLDMNEPITVSSQDLSDILLDQGKEFNKHAIGKYLSSLSRSNPERITKLHREFQTPQRYEIRPKNEENNTRINGEQKKPNKPTVGSDGYCNSDGRTADQKIADYEAEMQRKGDEELARMEEKQKNPTGILDMAPKKILKK